MKYMVMECCFSYAVVLDEAGRFLKVANRHYEVGQTVTDVIEIQAPQPAAQKKNKNKWMYSLTAMAACLVLVMSIMFFRMPYASVYLTINPEVRIDVNRNDTVVGVEGMNDDGMDLLKDYEHRKKDLDTVMDELVDRAIDMGYLSEGGTVTLTLDADDEWVVSHSDSLSAHLNEHLTQSITVTIEVTEKIPPQTHPGQKVVIPLEPDREETVPVTQPSTQQPNQPAGDSGYGDTDYGGSGDGVTDYDAADDRGNSGYDEDDSGDSSYEEDD